MAKKTDASAEKLKAVKKYGPMALALILAALVLFFAGANSGLKNDLEVAEVEIANLAEERAALVEVNEELDSRVGALEEQVSDLESVNEALETEKSELEEIRTELEQELAQIELGEVVEGYLIDEIDFGSDLEEVIDDGEYDVLQDGKIEFDGDKYDVHEEILLSSDVVLMTSGFGYDEELAEAPYLGFLSKGAIAYRFVFDDDFDMTEVSEDEPLKMDFLGRRLEIISIDADEMVVRDANKYTLLESEEQLVEGLSITLIDVGLNEDVAILEIDGELFYVDLNEDISVGDKELIVDEIIATNSEDKIDVAIVYVGDGVADEYENGDYLLEKPDWYFYWDTASDNLNFFELSYEEKSDELDDDYSPLAIGESLMFPWESFKLEFMGYESEVSYMDVEMFFDCEDAKDDLTSDTCGVWLETNEEIFLVDDEEVDSVFLVRTGSFNWDIYYENDDGDFTEAGSDLDIKFEDTELEVELETSGDGDIVIDDGFGEIRFDVRPLDEKLGDIQDESEADEIKYGGNSFGTSEFDVLTGYGIILVSPDSHGEDDEALFRIPSEQVQGRVRVI